MAKKVFIMRGVPGSGKSTRAQRIAKELVGPGESCVICSADDFHMIREEESGPLVYRFNPTKIAEAHAACMRSFLSALGRKTDVVIVDNTNIRTWEYESYIIAARLVGYEVAIHECLAETVADIQKFAARNTHGVPLSVIANMAVEYEV